MKIFMVVPCCFLSFALHANSNMPCQVVGFDKVAENAILADGSLSDRFSIQNKIEAVKLLKKCLDKYAVCIVGEDPKKLKWVNTRLIEPQNNNFDPLEKDLMFGMVQYRDKKSGKSICIAAVNSFAKAIKWMGSSWIIDGKNIKELSFSDERFSSVMTPKALYHALLQSHKDSVASDKRANDPEWIKMATDDRDKRENKRVNIKINAARRLLEGGSDVDFVSKMTDLPIDQVRLLEY